jgi:ParB family transcriptional regulator, chromosome partitioning protein
MNHDHSSPQVREIPISRLVLLRERRVSPRFRAELEASLREKGLLDPLIVLPLGEVSYEDVSYEVRDGAIRYQILLEMGVETVPCVLEDELTDTSRGKLGLVEELRMLRGALEDLDEETIARALAVEERDDREDVEDD